MYQSYCFFLSMKFLLVIFLILIFLCINIIIIYYNYKIIIIIINTNIDFYLNKFHSRQVRQHYNKKKNGFTETMIQYN